jgi:hypothetical protein
MRSLFVAMLVFTSISIKCQTIVKMSKVDGLYLLPCKVNGKTSSFIFDTGASSLLVSIDWVKERIKDGSIKIGDIASTVINYTVASGSVEEGRMMTIRKFEIGDLFLTNVKALIANNSNAPLLLGQNALEQFGEFSFEYKTNTLTIKGNAKSDSKMTSSAIKNKQDEITKEQPQLKALLNDNSIKIWLTQYSKSKQIVSDLEFDLYNIKHNQQTGSVQIDYDITNNSGQDYSFLSCGFIHAIVEVSTDDNKTYSASTQIPDIINGTTVKGYPLSVDIRDKNPKFLRIYATPKSPIGD